MEISVAADMKRNAPSYYLRFKSIFDFLKNCGKIGYQEIVKRPVGPYRRISFNKETDIIVIARIIDPGVLKKIFYHASENNIPVLYETDDLLLYERRNDAPIKEQGALLEYLTKASCIVTSTQYLADELRKYNCRVFVFPNLLDSRIWSAEKENRRDRTGRINICCIGTGMLPENLQFIVPAMEHCQRAYGSDVIFHLWGNERYIEKKIRKFKNIKLIEGKVPYRKFARTLQKSCFDIAVAPLCESHFNRAKSNIKYLEYSISGISSLFSRTGPYKDLADGQNCILVDHDPDDWRDKIVRMIDDRELRHRCSDLARMDVLNNYMLDKQWAEQYLSILKTMYDH